MVWKIDQRPCDRFRGISAHGVSGYAYAVYVDFCVEARNPFLQISERIQKEGNIPRAAFPQSGIFQRFADGLREACVLVADNVALYNCIVVDGLNRNVTVSCPMACKRFAASVRSAGAMGKNDDRIFAGNHRVEDSNAHILVMLLVMEHQTCDFVYCQWSGFKLVAVWRFVGQRWQ